MPGADASPLRCALLATVALAMGCKPTPRPPTERLAVVASAEAPLLNECEDDEGASQIGHQGDLLIVRKQLPPMHWKSPPGASPGASERDGPMVVVSQSPDTIGLYGFASDLGPEIDVPTAAWICAAIQPGDASARPAKECAAMLHRAKTSDGAIVAFVPCVVGSCAVALVRDRKVTSIHVDGLTSAYLISIEGRPVLLVSSRWVHDGGNRTGGSLVPIDLQGPAPVAQAAIPLDEVDARDAEKVSSRSVRMAITGAVVHVTGERREVVRKDGRELARAPIDETHPLR